MIIKKIVCDGCKKEILSNPIQLHAETVNLENGELLEDFVYCPDYDLCEECFQKIKDFTEALVHQDPEKKVEAVFEKPVELLPKQTPEEFVNEKKADAKPTLRELILNGISKEDAIKITGCNPASYDTTKYQLKKKGLLKCEEPKQAKPVKCSERGKDCAYGCKAAFGKYSCDYLVKVGHSRGCDPEECTVFKKK